MRIINRTPFPFAFAPARVLFPKHTATVVLKASYSFAHDETAKALDAPLQFEGDMLDAYDADLALFKPKTDILMKGTAHAPEGKPAEVVRVRLRVGGWEKAVAVIGDRARKATPPPPQKFTSMPITWSRAFGGPKYAANPIGCGLEGDVLPNIEDPDHLIQNLADQPKPAGFGPIHRLWKARASKMGTYKKKWLKSRFPAFAEDFDWTYFNAAPEDQQLEGYFKGDEDFSLNNLHPTLSRIHSRLPGTRFRCFVKKKKEREITLNLDTVWIDADALQIVTLWRGVVEVASEEMEDVDAFLIMDGDGKPDFSEPAEEQEPEYAAPEPPEIRSSIDMKEVEKLKKQAETGWKDNPVFARRKGLDALVAGAAATSMSDVNAMWTAMAARQTAMGRPVPDAVRQAMELTKPGGELETASSRKVPPRPEDPAEQEGELLDGADLSGQDLSGRDFTNAVLTGANLSKANLKGAVLTNADLSECDLTGAVLEGAVAKSAMFARANLSGAKAAGMNAEGAIFQECDLSKADLKGATLKEAGLEMASVSGADFTGADLTGLRGRELKGPATFVKVKADGSVWSGSMLKKSDFSEAELGRADFTGADLTGAKLERAVMKNACFRKATLEKARVVDANLLEANFTKAKLAGADFRRSNLYGANYMDAKKK